MAYPRATKEQLADRSRYQFKAEAVDIPELELSVEVKTLSVKERDALPDLVEPVLDAEGQPTFNKEGKPITKIVVSVEKMAATWAQVVSDPKVTAEEAEAFLDDLPAPALDRVIEQFTELLSTKEKAAETRSDFRPPNDES